MALRRRAPSAAQPAPWLVQGVAISPPVPSRWWLGLAAAHTSFEGRSAEHTAPFTAQPGWPVHGSHLLGFSAASPWKPAPHSQTRSAVAVPALFCTAFGTQLRTGAHAPAPALDLKVEPSSQGVHVRLPW